MKRVRDAAIGLFVMFILSFVASAETRYYSEMPAGQVSTRDAIALLAKNDSATVFKCQRKRVGSNLTLINVKNSRAVFFVDLKAEGLSDDQSDALLAENKQVVKCDLMEFDSVKKRLTRVDSGE